uniref:Secreted protein n=1 Tax=Syphacia muris TaxID=451379 RepID=A0A0N5ACU5_9BILA
MSVVATALGYSLLLIATSVKTQMLAEDAQEGMCHMCNELMSERYVDTNDLQEEQLEEDKKDVKGALKDIEKKINEIDSRIWWLPPSDVEQLHNESEVVLASVVNKALSYGDIETQASKIQNKLEVYEAEKETNKAKAVEQWGMLFSVRQRLYNLEKVLLDVVVLARDLATVSHMDKLRMLADVVAQKLKKVMDYYETNNEIVQTAVSNLAEINTKKSELKSAGSKKKCAFLFFFCK